MKLLKVDFWKTEKELRNGFNRVKMPGDLGRRRAKTWEGGECLVRSRYRLRIVKQRFYNVYIGGGKAGDFPPRAVYFPPFAQH